MSRIHDFAVSRRRKASQRRASWRAPAVTVAPPRFASGNRVRWKDRSGVFQRDLGDGNAQVLIAGRVYRVKLSELLTG